MSENYIVINGKKAELTPEQLKALGLEKEINPFERVKKWQSYWFISRFGTVVLEDEECTTVDNNLYNAANYCTDKEMMQQRALHETLDRLLWRYSMEHGGSEINWSDDTEKKYQIMHNHHACEWIVAHNIYYQMFGTPYFHTKETAENAIKEIVEPFMAEHPDFKL